MRTFAIKIRPYRGADFGAVTWLCLESWKSNGVKTPIFESAVTCVRRRLGAELAKGSTHVATIRSRIVGFVLFHGNEVADLFVASGFQGHGIGKQLLDFAKAERPDGFWLTALAQNVRARRFYEREGLKHTKTRVGRRPGYRVVWYEWKPGPPSRPRYARSNAASKWTLTLAQLTRVIAKLLLAVVLLLT